MKIGIDFTRLKCFRHESGLHTHAHKHLHLTFSSIGYKLPSCRKLILQYLHRYGDSCSRAVLSRHKSALKNVWRITKKPKEMKNFSINLPHLRASWELSGEVSHCLFNSFEWKITYFLEPDLLGLRASLGGKRTPCFHIFTTVLSHFPSALLHNRNLCVGDRTLWESHKSAVGKLSVNHMEINLLSSHYTTVLKHLVTWKLLSSQIQEIKINVARWACFKK